MLWEKSMTENQCQTVLQQRNKWENPQLQYCSALIARFYYPPQLLSAVLKVFNTAGRNFVMDVWLTLHTPPP